MYHFLFLEIPTISRIRLYPHPTSLQSVENQPVIETVVIRELRTDLFLGSLVLKPPDTHTITPHQIGPKPPYNIAHNTRITDPSARSSVNRKTRFRPPPPSLTGLRAHLPRIYDLFIRLRLRPGLLVKSRWRWLFRGELLLLWNRGTFIFTIVIVNHGVPLKIKAPYSLMEKS
jgi:hypothetical protein